MIKWYDVTAIAPQLSAAPASTQTQVLAMVDRQIDDTMWGTLADDGRRYLAAHLGTLAMRGGNGFITEESVGQLSVSYATPQKVYGSLAMTGYGVEYERLSRLTGAQLGFVP